MLKMIEAATPSELRLKVGCQTDLERILINFTHHCEQNTNGLTYEDIELNEEKKRLAAHVNANNQTSSKAPSSDGHKKTDTAFPRQVIVKNIDGQPNLIGHIFYKVTDPDSIVYCQPEVYLCGQCLETEEGPTVSNRPKVDVPEVLIPVSEHQQQVKKNLTSTVKNTGNVNVMSTLLFSRGRRTPYFEVVYSCKNQQNLKDPGNGFQQVVTR